MGNKTARIVLELVFLAVFNLLFFMLCGTDNPSSVWISYGFIHASYLLLLMAPAFERDSRGTAVLGYSVYSILLTYFVAELIAGLVFIVLRPEGYLWSLLVQVVLMAVFLIVFLSSYLANSHTRQAIETQRYEAGRIKDLAARLNSALRLVTDAEAYRAVERCYDEMKASPTQSSPAVADLENAISADIQKLRSAAIDGNKDELLKISKVLQMKIQDRNQTLRINQ